MEEEFVPYKIALELKELGFDELCFAKYQKLSECAIYQLQLLAKERNCNRLDTAISAPTYSQAFRWFREKYKYIGIVLPFGDNLFDYRIYSADKGEHLIGSTEYETYEDAELECLKKLIEIVKEKK